MMKTLVLLPVALLLLSGCGATSYQQLATQAGVRVSAVNGELTKLAKSARLASQDRAHATALLDEVARKLQIEADRELRLRDALEIKSYAVLVRTTLKGADDHAAAIAGLSAGREALEREIQAEYEALVVHAQELSAAAKGLAQLGRPLSGADALAFLFQFAMDVGQAYADAAKDASAARQDGAALTAKTAKARAVAGSITAHDARNQTTTSIGRTLAGLFSGAKSPLGPSLVPPPPGVPLPTAVNLLTFETAPRPKPVAPLD